MSVGAFGSSPGLNGTGTHFSPAVVILPLPVFDGGKIVLIVLQAIDKKRFSLELQAKIEQGGVVVLICLAVLITIKDIFVFKGIFDEF